MRIICLNGKFMPADQPVLQADNRGYRYGDGLFETIKVVQGRILLESLHFERLLTGLRLLKFDIPYLFTPEKIRDEILQLCKKNNCAGLARVRLSVARGNGGLYDANKTPEYLIECWPLSETVNQLNENGLIIDIFPDARKSCDIFSGIKSANYLPYVMAAEYAKDNKLNDCLVLNQYDRIADATIANIFIVKEGVILTPSLSEGCVNGVMRKLLLEKLTEAGYNAGEGHLVQSDIENADEVFLSNAINGIRWVKQFRTSRYQNKIASKIYQQVIQTIFE